MRRQKNKENKKNERSQILTVIRKNNQEFNNNNIKLKPSKGAVNGV